MNLRPPPCASTENILRNPRDRYPLCGIVASAGGDNHVRHRAGYSELAMVFSRVSGRGRVVVVVFRLLAALDRREQQSESLQVFPAHLIRSPASCVSAKLNACSCRGNVSYVWSAVSSRCRTCPRKRCSRSSTAEVLAASSP